MAIEYVRVQRNISTGYSPGLKYLAVIKKVKKVPIDQVFDDIIDLSSLSKGDVKNAIDNFFFVISKYFVDGRGVDLGEYGEFQVTLQAKSVDTLEEVIVESIKKVNISYRIGTKLREELKETSKTLGSLEVKGYQPKTTEPETP